MCSLPPLHLSLSFRRIWELPLSIPWTLHWGENHRPERNWNREKSQQSQRDAFSPQTRLRSGMETPYSTSYPPTQSTHYTPATFLFFFNHIKKKHIQTLLTSERLIFGIKTFSQHTYDISWPSLLPDHLICGSQTGRDQRCPAEIRKPHREKTLSSLTFPLAPPLSKSHGCFTSERTLYCVCGWHFVGYCT